jgi:predicted membrane channel-forming protein YqfA (hemolysin III family)
MENLSHLVGAVMLINGAFFYKDVRYDGSHWLNPLVASFIFGLGLMFLLK